MCVCILTRFELCGVRHRFSSQTTSLSTQSRSHGKGKRPARFPSHQITTSVPWRFLNEGPDVRHMQICSRGERGGKRCRGERLLRNSHTAGGNTSFLAWWFLKWLIRLQQLAKERPGSRGGRTYSSGSVSFLGIASVSVSVGSASQNRREITCPCLRCERSTCGGSF